MQFILSMNKLYLFLCKNNHMVSVFFKFFIKYEKHYPIQLNLNNKENRHIIKWNYLTQGTYFYNCNI